MKPKEEFFRYKIDKIFSTHFQKTSAIISLLGCAGVMIDNLDTNDKNLPMEAKYACALVASTLLACISDTPRLTMQMQDSPYAMSEQTQESIHRRMKQVITEIYNSLEADEV